MTRQQRPRHLARLVAYDAGGEEVMHVELPLGVYYEDLHDLIDDVGFRREHGVVRVVGELYDDDGRLFQKIDNTYGSEGELEHGHVEHEDGTVTDVDPESRTTQDEDG